jgi:hypothetical protein
MVGYNKMMIKENKIKITKDKIMNIENKSRILKGKIKINSFI